MLSRILTLVVGRTAPKILQFKWLNASLQPTRDRSGLGETGPGDLVVRDLGYFSLPTLQALDDQDSLFLSRLRYGVAVSDPETGKRIDLLEEGGLLEGTDTIDLTVEIGVETSVLT